MIRIGLTGSIGMGKSTVAAMFEALGARTWSADDAVHRLYSAGGGAVARVGALFPSAIVDGAVDRARLAKLVLADQNQLRLLEEIVHPLVGEDRLAFAVAAGREGAEALVFDIPLLLEGGMRDEYDAVVVVSAPAEVQRERVLARPGMSEQKLEAILSQQMPDEKKRHYADHIIDTGQTIAATKEQVAQVYKKILAA
ncbi:MAG: dephospho-CoA kinase [Pseudomonadota bacterium]